MTELDSGIARIDGVHAISNGCVIPYYVSDRKIRIAIARVNDRMYAFNDLCPCADEPCPLSGGLLTGTTIMCQCHGSRFDVATGAVISGPASKPLTVYEVQQVDDTIQIRA